MVIKGGARAEADKLAAHLLRVDTNERVDVRELLGVCAPNLTSALREMEGIASAARSRRPFYHASINTAPDELMTDAQKARAIDRLEQELGLAGQPRIVVEHVKEGREHLHIAWSRIDSETLCAIPDSHNYRRHEIVARDLEREFGHARVQGAHHERDGVERPARRPSHAETMQAERSFMTAEEAKARLRELWQSADSGQAFAAALDHAGWILAQGDRRGFVALDPTGEVRSVNKDITGLSAAKVRERLGDIDPARLPSVDAARGQLRDLQRQAEAQAVPELEPVERDEQGLDADIALEAAASEAVPETKPVQDDIVALKSPEDMRREWATLMRDGAAPEVLAEPAPAATPNVEPQPVPKVECAAPPTTDRKTQASDPAADRKAWTDRLRGLETTDPAAKRKAWAARLRRFADEQPAPAPEREIGRREARTSHDRPEPAEEAPKAPRRGLFERIRTFVRSWWESKPSADAAPDCAADRQSDVRRDKPVVEARQTPSVPPAAAAASTPSPPIETVRRRSVSQEMLDEAQASIDADRARETPAQRIDRERRASDTERGRDHGNGSDRARYHHNPLLNLPSPWQHRRMHSQTPQCGP